MQAGYLEGHSIQIRDDDALGQNLAVEMENEKKNSAVLTK